MMFVYGAKTNSHKGILKQNSENNLLCVAQIIWLSCIETKNVDARANGLFSKM